MQTAGIDVFFVGALHRETGLIFRQAQDRGYDLRLVAPSSSATGDFPNQRVGRKSKDFCGSERPVAARGADLSLIPKSAGPRVGPLHTHQ